jgi:multiple sugar transport system ATP-binding protein
MAKVSFHHVFKRFGELTVVKDFNLEIEDREFVVLVGPSGCGKSTTLRMVAGLEEITEGTIAIGDRVVNEVAPKDRDIAMVFQNYALYPHMNVFDNMAFGLRLRKFPRDQIRRRVEEAARILGIEELLERKPKALSGGQRQRVAVGRAIVRRPAVFLFDEPLSNLDAKLRVQMRAEISQLHSTLRTTTIYVTHDQVEAMTMGERIVIMKDGVLQQVGRPLEVYERPANQFVAGFIGSPAMNFFAGELRESGGETWIEAGEIRLRLPAELVAKLPPGRGLRFTFGIRPEMIDELGEESTGAPDGSTVRAMVRVVEPMGAETILHLTAGPHQLVARVDARSRAAVGHPLLLRFRTERIHVFDMETEEAYT